MSGRNEREQREKEQTGFESVLDAEEESLREHGLRDLRLHTLFVGRILNQSRPSRRKNYRKARKGRTWYHPTIPSSW